MNKFSTAIIITLLFEFGLCTPVYTEELDENQIDSLLNLDLDDLMGAKVTIASKRQENVSEAPSVVTVVTAQEISQYGARNLKDVLNRVTGIQGLGTHFYSNFVSLRGQLLKHSNNEILFLVNGRPHRTSRNGGTTYSLLLSFPLSVIERIEIIRGPGSVLYGSGAFAGTINIITKSGETLDDHQVSATYGSFDSKGVEAVTGGKINELETIAGFKKFKSDGWKFEATGETGITDSVDMREDDTGVVALANYRGASINVVYTNTAQDNLGLGARWPSNSQYNKHLLMDTGYKHAIGASWNAEYHLTYNNLEFAILGNEPQTSDDVLAEFTAISDLSGNFNMLFGSVYEHQQGKLSDDSPYSSSYYSIYAQGDYTPLDSLKITAGFQWNKVRDLEGDISPRLALVSNFSETWGAKLLYGEAFRSAYATERFIDNGRLKGDPNLEPEKIATTEALIFFHAVRYYASLNYYHSKITNFITRSPVGGGVFQFINDGEIDFDGVELEGKATLSQTWQLQGSLSYQRQEDSNGTEDITLAPNLMAKLGVVYESLDGYSLGLFDTYFGEPAEVKSLNPSVSEVNPEPEAYHLVSANLLFDIPDLLGKPALPNMIFSIYIDNLLDEDIHYPEITRKRINSIPIHSGRAVYGTFAVKF